MSYETDLFSHDPWRTYIINLAESKTSQDFGTIVLKGIGCNTLVCLCTSSLNTSSWNHDNLSPPSPVTPPPPPYRLLSCGCVRRYNFQGTYLPPSLNTNNLVTSPHHHTTTHTTFFSSFFLFKNYISFSRYFSRFSLLWLLDMSTW